MDASRSHTMINAMKKLEMLSRKTYCVHIVGADFREGESVDQVMDMFQDFINAMQCETLILCCIGPNVLREFDIAVSEKLRIVCSTGVWEDCAEKYPSQYEADIAFCFNAGIWGYDTWPKSIAFIIQVCPVIITSYNEWESDDDFDALETYFDENHVDARWAWRPMLNPYRSATIRNSVSVPGRTLTENNSWQCILSLQKNVQQNA